MNLWIKADKGVPQSEETVLAIINGKCGRVTFKNCYQLVSFDGKWFCEDWPEMENLEVLFWTPLPNLPRELCPYGSEDLLPCEVNCNLTCEDCLLEEVRENEK